MKRDGIEYEEFLRKFKESVKKQGLNNTYHRDLVLKVLFSCTKHLNAEEIRYKIKTDLKVNIGIATIYRILNLFEQMNIVKSLIVDEKQGKMYELSINSHHDHLICTECGRIEEFYDEEIESLQKKVAQKSDFKLLNHNMILYGLCQKCQNNE